MKKRVIKAMTTLLVVTLIINYITLISFSQSDIVYSKEQDLISSDKNSSESKPVPVPSSPRPYNDIPVKSFQVCNLSPDSEIQVDYTEWWYSQWDNCRYVFLPATADRNNLIINYSADATVFLNDKPIQSGISTSVLNEADEFNIKVGETDCGTLKIMQSNLGCIYLSTSSKGLDALDNNSNIVETGSAIMLDADGSTIYSGEIEKITAHGNSSWGYSSKKSYNFKLPEKSKLYGMKKAKKWVLLSNFLDHSMLRNKITEEMCKAAKTENVMNSVFVDLYADGSYRGTYQLSERVQIQKNRINIKDLEEQTEKLNDKKLKEYPQKVVGASNAGQYVVDSYKYYDIPNDPEDITGGYLLQFQQSNRYGYKASSGFITSRGQAIGIDGPEYASEAQVLYIRNFVQDMEDAIYSPTGFNSKGKHYTEYLDINSLIKAYLIEEISMNIDATSSSFFLWKDSDLTGDGKIHFNPAWDFDLSYNNFPTIKANSDGDTGYSYRPDNLFAAYFATNGYNEDGAALPSGEVQNIAGRSWLGQLYKNQDFVRSVAKIYFSDFEPFLTGLTSADKPYANQLAETISPSAEMNNMRWHTYGGEKYCVFGSSSGENFMGSVSIVRNFIEKRKNWLSELWYPCAFIHGDVNDDGEYDIADIVMLQKWLLGSGELLCRQSADVCKDNNINIFDLCVMKQDMLK